MHLCLDAASPVVSAPTSPQSAAQIPLRIDGGVAGNRLVAFTGVMQTIRLAAVQAAILAKPKPVLDPLGFGLPDASGSFESIFGIRMDRPNNAPSVKDGFVAELRLDHGIDASQYWQQDSCVKDLCSAFATYRDDTKKSRNATIIEAIARTLP